MPAASAYAAGSLRSGLIEPNRGKILPEIVAGGHIPAVDLLVEYNDPLPPQQGDVVGLGQGIALHLAHELGALGDVDGAALLFVHVVDLGVGMTGVARR